MLEEKNRDSHELPFSGVCLVSSGSSSLSSSSSSWAPSSFWPLGLASCISICHCLSFSFISFCVCHSYIDIHRCKKEVKSFESWWHTPRWSCCWLVGRGWICCLQAAPRPEAAAPLALLLRALVSLCGQNMTLTFKHSYHFWKTIHFETL